MLAQHRSPDGAVRRAAGLVSGRGQMYIWNIGCMGEPIVEAMAQVRAHLADSIDRARREATPTIITRRGKAEAVIIDLDEYQRLKKLEERVEDAWLSQMAADSLAEGREPAVTLEDLAAQILGEAAQA